MRSWRYAPPYSFQPPQGLWHEELGRCCCHKKSFWFHFSPHPWSKPKHLHLFLDSVSNSECLCEICLRCGLTVVVCQEPDLFFLRLNTLDDFHTCEIQGNFFILAFYLHDTVSLPFPGRDPSARWPTSFRSSPQSRRRSCMRSHCASWLLGKAF